MRNNLLCAFCFILIIVLACHKSDIKTTTQPPAPPVISTSPSPITATIQGNVFNENEQPVSGVSITVGAKTTTTDYRGYFRIDNASLDKNASLLTGQMAGYFKIVRTFAATSGVNYQRIKLVKRNLAGTINASSGGSITLADGSTVALPANGIVKKADNSSYKGSVNVYAANINPTAPDIVGTIPGSLMGNDSSGKRVGLQSYGMLAVELESAAAEPLQIASGKSATLSFNIPSSLQSSAPAQILLWYIDDSTGLWKQQGTAAKSGNAYTAQVSHFSFWNCDNEIFNSIVLSLTLKTIDNKALQFALVKITSTSHGITYGFTDSLGQVSGLVPASENLTLDVIGYNCGANLYEKQIGPLTSSSNIGNILIDTSQVIVNVTGRLVDCNNLPVKNGVAVVYYGYIKYSASANDSGAFSISLLRCGSTDTSIQVVGINTDSSQQGLPVSVLLSSSHIIDVGNVGSCGTIPYQYIMYTVDNESYTFYDSNSVITDSLVVYNGVKSVSVSAQANTWDVYGTPGNGQLAFIDFNDLGTTGTQPIFVHVPGYNQPAQFSPPDISLNLTNYPTSKGQFFDGNFSGNTYYLTNLGTTNIDTTYITMSCSFHVRRNW